MDVGSGVLGFCIACIFMGLLALFINLAEDARLNDESIQCGKLGYDKAFVSNGIFYCAHELERIDNE